jgi:4-hydroxy-tetrahydrodipicolinate reductase
MRIGLIGYGNMGRQIEQLAPQRQHTVVRIFTKDHPLWAASDLSQIDVLVDFSRAEAVLRNIETAASAKINLVEGPRRVVSRSRRSRADRA